MPGVRCLTAKSRRADGCKNDENCLLGMEAVDFLNIMNKIEKTDFVINNNVKCDKERETERKREREKERREKERRENERKTERKREERERERSNIMERNDWIPFILLIERLPAIVLMRILCFDWDRRLRKFDVLRWLLLRSG
jgi:hypothetical protein